MVFGDTTYRPAKKVSHRSIPTFPDVDDVSDIFQNPSWGLYPIPGGPNILRSGPATVASTRVLEILDYAGGSCAHALDKVQAQFGLGTDATDLTKEQSRLYTSLTTKDLIKTLDHIRNDGLGGVKKPSVDFQFYVLDKDTWNELLSDPDVEIRTIRQEPDGWTEYGSLEVGEAWDRYANPPVTPVDVEQDEDAGSDTDGGPIYFDAEESLLDSTKP
jgi:hypothetical protein